MLLIIINSAADFPLVELVIASIRAHCIAALRDTLPHHRRTELYVLGDRPRVAVFRQQGVRQREMTVAYPSEAGADGRRPQLQTDLMYQLHQVRACLICRMHLYDHTQSALQQQVVKII